MDIIQMLQDAHMARINLKALNDMVEDANWLGGGSGMTYVSRSNTGKHADPTAKAAERLMAMRDNLENAKAQAIATYDTAIKALNGIPDSDMRRILYLRHIKNLKWHDIAVKFGAGYSSDKIKQRYSRYKRSLSS
jgi:hypothetical protein